jgi:hypothetical protein
MGKCKCDHCGKVLKTKAGLARHISTSMACMQARNHLEFMSGKGLETKPSGKNALGKTKTNVQLGKRKGQLAEDDLKPPAKSSLVMGKAHLENVIQKRLQNIGQEQVDKMGWLPYQRSFAQENMGNWEDESDTTREDGMVEGNNSDNGGGYVSDASGDDSNESGDEADGTDSEEDAESASNREEIRRDESTWKQFMEYVEKVPYTFLQSLTENEERGIRIMRTLIKKKAPLDTYKAVMEWHFRDTGKLGTNEAIGECPDYISREKLIKVLRKRYHMEHQYAQPVTTTLPHSGSKVTVWRKLAKDNVLSLLTDPRWTDEDWLFFGDDPFASPPDDYPYIDDLNTGEAYMATYKKLITKPNQILVPIPLYIDGAVTGQFDKLQVTALKMSIGILNRRARDREYAWRTLGYVSNYTKEDSRGKRIFFESGHIAAHELYVDGLSDEEEGALGNEQMEVDKAADYHAILEVLLESLKELIATNMEFDFFYKGRLHKNCELLFFVPFVKCDGDEGDKLCCSYRSRGKDISQLCRYCLCPTDETDDPNAQYPYKSETMLKNLFRQKNVQRHKELSQICIKNAFHGLRFGLHNDRGIHGATPWELLHGVLLGLFKYTRDCFFMQLGETSQTAQEINALAQVVGQLLQRQSDRNKPRTKFAKGILKGKLMAKEYGGVLLVLAAILQCKEGRRIITTGRRKIFREIGQISDWILLIDTLLQWEAYLNLSQMRKIHVRRLQKKHRYLLYLLKRIGARDKGMGFKVMKFHAVLHLALDIRMFGVPMVVDTGSNESHHKTTKVAAKLTQKDVQTFEKQTSDRLDDFHVLDLAMEEMNGRPLWHYCSGYQRPETPPIAEKPNTTGGMILNVLRENESQKANFRVMTRMKNSDTLAIDTHFLEYCLQIQEDLQEFTEKIPICAEHCRGGQMFRSHPNYRGKGPWRDWVMIDWGQDGDFPGMIWGFIDLVDVIPAGNSVMLSNGTSVQKGVWAVIESCFHKDADEVGEIFQHIILECESMNAEGVPTRRKFYLVDVETFKSPLVVIPNVGTKSEYLLMTPKTQWPTDFENWIMASHAVDDAEMEEPPVPAAAAAAAAAAVEESSDTEGS